MKTTIAKLLNISAAFALCLAGTLCVTGCSNNASDDTADKGSVAAVLGDTSIYENDVTRQIEAIRAQYGYTDDSVWAMMLSMSDYTPETFREYTIKSMTYDQVVPVAAAQKSVTVAAADVDAAVQKMKETYGLSDEQWATALTNSGFTEESYRKTIELSLMEQALYDQVTADAAITDEYFMTNGMPYVESYYGDIKRSSHILFAPEDLATAQSVLAQLQAGTITFADAVAQYSIDTGSAVAGGDVGWSGIHTFVDEYQTALDQLAVGEMSGLVESQFGYHIILCTDAFTYTADTKVADLPTDVYDHICTNYLSSRVANDTYNDFIDGVRDGMGFTVYPMPQGLSYDVDVEAALAGLQDDHDHDHEGETAGTEISEGDDAAAAEGAAGADDAQKDAA